MKNRYFLLRHGQTEYQAKRRKILYRSGEEIKLTNKGKSQIKRAAKRLKDIDIIFSSDIYRTRQTAEIVKKETGKNISFDKRLRDTNFGEFHGKSQKSFHSYFKNIEERFSKRPPKGESWNDVIKRLKSFLKDVEKENKGKNILIVSHGEPLRFLEGIVKGEDLKKSAKNRFNLGQLKKI